MNCPQTKAECKSPVGCGAMGCSILEDNPPHKPTMAEIERLVDAHSEAAQDALAYGGHFHNVHKTVRDALLAAIKLYGEG